MSKNAVKIMSLFLAGLMVACFILPLLVGLM